jgi:uncharacterized protein (DUF486 family)
MITALLLFISNIFMTLAWYGHLKFKDKPLWLVIVASWALAGASQALRVYPHQLRKSWIAHRAE